MSATSKSLHGFTRGTQVSAMTDVDPKLEMNSERTASLSAEAVVVSNRVVASWSSRQPRLSFSSFAPFSENDYSKRLKSDVAEETPPQREELPVLVKERDETEEEEEEEVKRTWNLRPRKACGGLKRGNGVFMTEVCGGGVGGASELKYQKSVMASRRNVRYAQLPGDEDYANSVGGRRDFDPRFDYSPKAFDRVPWKSIALAVFLLLLGSLLLFLSFFIFTGHMEGDSSQGYALLVLGILTFLPGNNNKRNVEPFLNVIPRIVKAIHPPAEAKHLHVSPYSIKNVQVKPGLNKSSCCCGVYAIKYIECHVLGLNFSLLDDENIQEARLKIAVDLWNTANDTVLIDRMSKYESTQFVSNVVDID